MDLIIDRLRRALTLDPTVYPEIANDDNATVQAVGVAALASLIGSLFQEGTFVGRLISALIGAAIGLFIWSGIVFLSSKLFGGQAPYISLVRPIGYAAAPFALGLVPFLGFIGLIYSLIIQIRAVREVAGLSDGAAVAAVLLPFAIIVIPIVLLLLALGVALAGLGMAMS